MSHVYKAIPSVEENTNNVMVWNSFAIFLHQELNKNIILCTIVK